MSPTTEPAFQPADGDDGTEASPYRWPTDESSRLRRVEAVLVMARKPLSSRKLSQLAELESGTQATSLVQELNRRYDQHQQAFHIKRVAGGYQMRTRPQFADWIRRMASSSPPPKLSGPALETLTVVAYRQPIIKAEIEAIRGVSCGEMLRQLLERGLVKIAGRSEALGRPFLYATSNEFLTRFGLGSLKDLPRFRQLSGKGLPDWARTDDNHAPDQNRDPENTAPATTGSPDRLSSSITDPSPQSSHHAPDSLTRESNEEE